MLQVVANKRAFQDGMGLLSWNSTDGQKRTTNKNYMVEKRMATARDLEKALTCISAEIELRQCSLSAAFAWGPCLLKPPSSNLIGG